MHPAFWLVLLSVGLAAQTPNLPDLTRLTQELRTAIQNDSLVSAAELASRLDDAVQQRQSAWLIRDAGQRVKEILAWLPADTESLWVNQEPFTIKPEESVELLYGRPTQEYSVDRLMALNGGNWYRTLANRTVRLVVATARNIPENQLAIPGVAPTEDVAYFYFFAGPIAPLPPDESVQGRPVWYATAKIDAGGPPQPGAKREQRDDENWIALAQPDLLILSNRRTLLSEILLRIGGGTEPRALPADLPEWTQIDPSASFWGLRHYAPQSKPRREESGFETADLPRPDGAAVGVTAQFDSAQQRLEVRYLSGAQLAQRRGFADNLHREFQVDQPEAGVWRLIADVQKRGPWPVHFALAMLGFGMYR
jgi:hypothetical protein